MWFLGLLAGMVVGGMIGHGFGAFAGAILGAIAGAAYRSAHPAGSNDAGASTHRLAELERKIEHIRSTKAEVGATGNPGCLLQIVNGAKTAGIPLRTVHPITLLAEAYRRE